MKKLICTFVLTLNAFMFFGEVKAKFYSDYLYYKIDRVTKTTPHFLLNEDGYIYLYNSDEEIISDKILLTSGMFSNGMTAVLMADGSTGYMNHSGKVILKLPLDYSEQEIYAYQFSENILCYYDNESKTTKFYDTNGNISLETNKKTTGFFCNGLVAFYGKADDSDTIWFGYMDKTGKVVIPPVLNVYAPKMPPYFFENTVKCYYKDKHIRVDTEGNYYINNLEPIGPKNYLGKIE